MPEPVKFPMLEDLHCRSACCCCHCGLNCDWRHCCGVGDETSLCCLNGSLNCSLQTVQDKQYGRAFQRMITSCTILNCEMDEGCDMCRCMGKGLVLCCFKTASQQSMQCCPEPFYACQKRSHFFCYYGKCNAPCPATNDVPCEIGLFGIMCMNKGHLIEKFENEHPEDFYHGFVDEPMEPVTVTTSRRSKGGAPGSSDEMIRTISSAL